MLKTGVFITPDATYNITEISISGFYRVDFTRGDAAFNIDIDAIAYSMVQRKQTYEYGDSSIYNKYMEILNESASLQNLKEEQTSGWENGQFIVRKVSSNQSIGCLIETILVNGRLTANTVAYKGYNISMSVTDPDYDIKLEPINFIEYEKVVLSKDTVVEDGDSPYLSLDVLKRKYDLRHIEEKDYVVADTEEIAQKRLDEWLASKSMFKAVDTETTGLDVNMYGDDKLVGVILAQDTNTATYFPFRHTKISNLSMDFLGKIVAAMQSQQDRLVAHNTKFDRKVFLKEGYDVVIPWDTLQLSIIINPVFSAGVHALKTLADDIVQKKFLELDEIFTSAKNIRFDILPKELVKFYACPDGTNTLIVLQDLLGKLPKSQQALFQLESMLANQKADQEFYGIRVDVKKYQEQYRNCNYVIDKLERAFRQMTYEDGNINSPQVLSNLIYGKLKCPVLQRTATGLPSTSMASIKALANKKNTGAEQHFDDITDINGKVILKGKKLAETAYPSLLVLSKYREYNKLKTAFYARFEHTMKTGRVFFWINQNGAASGRQSSPMHQLPPELKDVIIADSDDKDFWGPDFSQIEIRMIAYLSGEKDLIELCKDPDNDIHRVIGSLISGKEMWEITAAERSAGKRRNFGFVYLISGRGLAIQMYGPGCTEEQIDYCQKQLDDLFHRFKRIDRYIKHNAQFVQEKGYMETKWFHRKRIFPDIFDKNIEPRRKASILRMANNMPVQGTAADYLKLAEVKMWNYIRDKGWNEKGPDGYPRVRPMLSIHDELIISTDRSIPYEEIVTMITRCMETPVDGAPPFFVQPAKMSCWGGHSDDSLAMPIRLRDKLIADYEATGKSVINHDNYVQVLNDYRKDVLEQYMQDLIDQYGTDYKAVGEHVRHPSLTHQLLGLYHDELESLGLSHEEQITMATKYYIDSLYGNATPNVIPADDWKSDKDLSADAAPTESLVELDKDGNVVQETSDEIEAYDAIDDTEVEEVNRRTLTKPIYVWELADCIVFDVQELYTKKDINSVLGYIGQRQEKDGFFRTKIIFNNKIIDTGMRVENFDIEGANDYILQLLAQQHAA